MKRLKLLLAAALLAFALDCQMPERVVVQRVEVPVPVPCPAPPPRVPLVLPISAVPASAPAATKAQALKASFLLLLGKVEELEDELDGYRGAQK
jgi:hypothetical protein